MNALLATARAVHFASVLLIFGELVFALAVAAPLLRTEAARAAGAVRDDRCRPCAVGLWCILVSLASWVAWFFCEAALMSGKPFAQALSGDTLKLVLETRFGRLWVLRLALAVALTASLWVTYRSWKNPRDKRHLLFAPLLIAGAYLASLAWAGHAAAGEAPQRDIQVSSDLVHLLAAGAWLGALPALLAMLRTASPPTAGQAARRFSVLGIASVSALLLTGIVNAWYLVGDLPGLLGTDYGWLLLAKLALFAAMLVLAATNRFVFTPRLVRGNYVANVELRRSAFIETAAGVAVVGIVGVLGITIPAAHQAPVWPFNLGLDLNPAYPTSYAGSPVRYTTTAIVHGAELYAQNCSSCHGALGHGDGPLAASLPVKPANLAEHWAGHRPGDLYWWIAHGIGTSMPAFAPRLSDTEIWTVVQFLRALSDAEAAEVMNGTMQPARAVSAPDFTFEIVPRVQESLSQQRAKHTTLLVFYTLPQSSARLRALSGALPAYAAHGTRIIAIPMQPDTETEPASESVERTGSILASVGADVAPAYAMFGRNPQQESGAGADDHVEFLIDDRAYLRRRWIGVPTAPEARTAAVLEQIDGIAQEPVAAAAPERHMH
jgi:putative copper resistance protein D